MHYTLTIPTSSVFKFTCPFATFVPNDFSLTFYSIIFPCTFNNRVSTMMFSKPIAFSVCKFTLEKFSVRVSLYAFTIPSLVIFKFSDPFAAFIPNSFSLTVFFSCSPLAFVYSIIIIKLTKSVAQSCYKRAIIICIALISIYTTTVPPLPCMNFSSFWTTVPPFSVFKLTNPFTAIIPNQLALAVFFAVFPFAFVN